MTLHILAIVVAILFIYEIYRLLNFGNAGGLAAVISRPLFGIFKDCLNMFSGLIIWIVELFGGYWAITHLWNWIIG